MTAGFFGRVPGVALLCGVVLLATATLTFAATSAPAPASPPPAAAPVAAPTLVVPDVRGQAYVFAKGMLEQAGFAWRVVGPVRGYAANLVAEQTPAPAAKVVGKGAPIVVLRLSQNGSYEQQGVPDDVSPYAGTTARLVGAKKVALKPAKTAVKTTPKAKPKSRAKAAPKAKATMQKEAAATRTPAFHVAGAPKEPLDEMPLTERAKKLAAWVEAHPKRTRAAVQHWLYQHTWIVTGARFGWSDGDEALRTLIAVDRRVQQLWGLGGRSEQVARRALAEVRERSK